MSAYFLMNLWTLRNEQVNSEDCCEVYISIKEINTIPNFVCLHLSSSTNYLTKAYTLPTSSFLGEHRIVVPFVASSIIRIFGKLCDLSNLIFLGAKRID